jgi:hypothetical protein
MNNNALNPCSASCRLVGEVSCFTHGDMEIFHEHAIKAVRCGYNDPITDKSTAARLTARTIVTAKGGEKRLHCGIGSTHDIKLIIFRCV